MKLTDEYKRITEQFKDLQGKFRHFEQVDTRKYAEVSVLLILCTCTDTQTYVLTQRWICTDTALIITFAALPSAG